MSFAIDEDLLQDLSTFLGDDLKSVIDIFLSHSSDLVVKLAQACDAEDVEQAVLLLHSFKGGAKNIGALTLARRCADLEDAAKAGQLDKVKASLSALESDVDTLRKRLPNFIS